MQVILLDYISTIVFAFNGTIAYMNVGSNLLIAVFCGLLTSIGGGYYKRYYEWCRDFLAKTSYLFIFIIFYIYYCDLCIQTYYALL